MDSEIVEIGKVSGKTNRYRHAYVIPYNLFLIFVFKLMMPSLICFRDGHERLQARLTIFRFS